MKDIKKFLNSFTRKITLPFPYLFSLKKILLVALIFGFSQVFITIFLEPHGTEKFENPFRNLLLAGYGFCIICSFIIHFWLERWIYSSSKIWKLYHEIISKVILTITIATSSYLYNRIIINKIPISLESWITHQLVFAWPYLLLFSPLIIIAYHQLMVNQDYSEPLYIIKGENKHESLTVAKNNFIYAKSEQNYVRIIFKEKGIVKESLIRSSLQNVADQIYGAVRIHRSFLINPSYFSRLKGNKRKRFAMLSSIANPIPVSPQFDENELN